MREASRTSERKELPERQQLRQEQASPNLELKQVEKVLREIESLLNYIIQSTTDGILVVDGKGKVLFAHYRFAMVWAYSG
jgi:PAS domain-containing protein